jgi:autotransporter strand-loop-strand O-heptosyltransferase
MIYDNLQKNPKPIVEIKNKILYNFVDGAFVEIKGTRSLYYLVKFINDDTNEVVYETRITNNQWARTSTKYFIRWRIEIYEKNHLVFHHVYNATDKTVLISFDSSSLGDNIAWIPYVLEFKKKHNCHVIVSTFKNFLFQDAYPELEFVNPGSKVDDLYASYLIGWFYDKGKEPALANTIPLQKTATNILGLDFQEIVTNLMVNMLQ